ncbi:hypothetical protein F4778DRAFT_755655 [Xylariomycetidae sp. FL2044]|nr:hypothetical protein F4778DRAFT_755655 [Xylariomycetidae sp. FL2044]
MWLTRLAQPLPRLRGVWVLVISGARPSPDPDPAHSLVRPFSPCFHTSQPPVLIRQPPTRSDICGPLHPLSQHPAMQV